MKPNKAMAWPSPRVGEKSMHDADCTGFLSGGPGSIYPKRRRPKRLVDSALAAQDAFKGGLR